MLLPELVVTGYPPEDLLLRPGFVRAARRTVDEIARSTRGIVALVGAPLLDDDLYNACYVLAHGEVRGVYRKRFLPNYGVFDEDRYFAPGRDLVLLARRRRRSIGPTICEDIWQPGPPATDLALAGAQLVANISASPFHVGKDREREEMLRVRARDNSCFVALLQRRRRPGRADLRRPFGRDRRRGRGARPRARLRGGRCSSSTSIRSRRSGGGSATCAGARSRRERAEPAAATELELAPPRDQPQPVAPVLAPSLDDLEQMRRALELGLRDYVAKNGFGDVVVGVSGGIDSALTAALARRGARRGARARRLDAVALLVRGHARDARRLAEALGIDFRELPIEPIVEAFAPSLAPAFAGREPDLTEENLQARDPRHAADGALEQVRLARGRDREQVGALGRLLDAVRRPRRRLRAAQGRLQDGRVPALAAAERAGGPRADPGVDHRARPERRAARRPARRGLAAAVRAARQGARGVRRARPLARGARPRTASTRTWSSARSR